MSAAEVAAQGFAAMERGDAEIITGFGSKLTALKEWASSAEKTAAATRKRTAPGTAEE
jgi:hypothetical protein